MFTTLIILASCAHFEGAKMSRINIGMEKKEVLKNLGDPKGTGARNNVEVLHYVEDKGWWQFDNYFVRLVDGKVESYGPEPKDNPVTDTNPSLKSQK